MTKLKNTFQKILQPTHLLCLDISAHLTILEVYSALMEAYMQDERKTVGWSNSCAGTRVPLVPECWYRSDTVAYPHQAGGYDGGVVRAHARCHGITYPNASSWAIFSFNYVFFSVCWFSTSDILFMMIVICIWIFTLIMQFCYLFKY